MNAIRLKIDKLLLAMGIIVLLCIAMPIGTHAASNVDVELYENIITYQQNASMANRILNETWGFDETGKINYPDDFAGKWIWGNKLIIALTSVDELTLEVLT